MTRERSTSGLLADGTAYAVDVPDAWNGVLINDFDYVSISASGGRMAQRMRLLRDRGYATSGTVRHRSAGFDPAREATTQLAVFDEIARFAGRPRRIVQYVCSGGGTVALALAEMDPSPVDGVVATCATMMVPVVNQHLDGFFVLRTLLAPDREDLLLDHVPAEPHAQAAVRRAWTEVVGRAQETPAGRARCALAAAIAQWGTCTDPAALPVDPHDAVAAGAAMCATAVAAVAAHVPASFRLMESAAGAGILFNTDVDHAAFLAAADPAQARAVQALYDAAGLDPAADTERLAAADRLAVVPEVMAWWCAPQRSIAARPVVPVLHVHTVADLLTPTSSDANYALRVARDGRDGLYRHVLLDAVGHCSPPTDAEMLALVEALVARIEEGTWGSARTPESTVATLRARADLAAPGGSPSRFVVPPPVRYNRTFWPDEHGVALAAGQGSVDGHVETDRSMN